MAVSGIGRTNVGYQTTSYQRASYSKVESFASSISAAASSTAESMTGDSLESSVVSEQDSMVYGRNPVLCKESQTFKEKTYVDIIKEKIEEILEKLQNAETEPTFQIGGASFTEKEWSDLLEKIDKIQEAIRKAMEEATSQKMETTVEEMEETTEETSDSNRTREETIEDAFYSESTENTIPSSDSQEEEVRYITWYTKEGIFCRKQGQTDGYVWSIKFTEDEQYGKVMNFLNQFDEKEHLSFASKENFWREFLSGRVVEEDFVDLYETIGEKE